jgi:hypothetical protein
MKPGNPSLMLEGANSFREILKDKKSSPQPLLTGEVFCSLYQEILDQEEKR